MGRSADEDGPSRHAAPGPALAYTCPNCSAPLEGRTCKLRCLRCGYFESCSDLEPAPTRRRVDPS